MRGFVVLRWRFHLPVVPRCLGLSPYNGSSVTGSAILHVIRSGHGSVDVEAFPGRVVVVGFIVGVYLSGVETSTPLFRQLLSERGDGVSPRS